MRPLGPLTCDGKAGFVGCTSSHFSLFLWKSDFRAPWCSSPSAGSGCGTVVDNIRGCFYMFPFFCAFFPRAIFGSFWELGLLHDIHMSKQLFLNPWWMHEYYLHIPYQRNFVSEHIFLMLAMALPVLTAHWRQPHLILWRCFTSGMCHTAVPFRGGVKE